MWFRLLWIIMHYTRPQGFFISCDGKKLNFLQAHGMATAHLNLKC